MPIFKEDPETKNLTVTAEDTLSNQKLHEEADLVVPPGMAPNTRYSKVPADIAYDTDGFIASNTGASGMYASGCAL